jgi:hypothetical protein
LPEGTIAATKIVDNWAIAVSGGSVLGVFLGSDPIVKVVSAFILLDMLLGVYVSAKTGKFKLKIFTDKLIKKLLSYFALVVLALGLEVGTGLLNIHRLVIGVIFTKEALSILSHVMALGVVKGSDFGFIRGMVLSLIADKNVCDYCEYNDNGCNAMCRFYKKEEK